MRNAFLDELLTLATEDESVVLLTGDLGFMVLEPFAERHPGRFFNVGVAEQNMVGLATGLAESGFKPFVYSIATFASLRPYEFIRNGPALHQLPVRVVGVGGGFDYAHNGVTHHALEELAVMRTQPRMSVIAPGDAAQARTALRAGHELDGPVYFRIGKGGGSDISSLEGRFSVGGAETIREGSDVALLATGAIVTETIKAAETLAERGISARVVLCASLSPAPTTDLIEALSDVRAAVTHEAAYANGGLGSLVSELVAEHRLDVSVTRCAVREMPSGATGSTAWLQRRYSIDADAVVEAT